MANSFLERSLHKLPLRFPYYIFNPKNSADIRRRYSVLCEYSLSLRKVPALPVKPKAGFTYLTLTCARDILMCKLSLESLARRAGALPELVVAHDESISLEEVRGQLGFWPNTVRCLNREQTASFHEDCGQPLLAAFCRRHIFGFKLAACLKEAMQTRVLYADGDVLWFSDPAQLMSRYTELPIYGTTDCHNSYNYRLIEKLPMQLRDRLKEAPFVNAGVAIYNHQFKELETYNEFFGWALEEDPVHQFSEQTLVALWCKTLGDIILLNDVFMSGECRTIVGGSFKGKPWVARHYVNGVREQIWTDAGMLALHRHSV